MRFLIINVFFLVILLGSCGAVAKKEKPSHFPFSNDLVRALRCDVCKILVSNVYTSTQMLFAEKAKTFVSVNEEDVLTLLEDVCNPFTELGQWIRRVSINSTGAAGSLQFGLRELPVFMECRRSCSTVVEACEAVIDHESMDQLSSRLLRVFEYASGDELARALCGVSSMCTERRQFGAARHAELLALVRADDAKEISQKEMEVERMMDRVERKENRRQHVFSRRELALMQDFVLRGDREGAAKVDPDIMKLNDEEFASLRSILRGKDTDFTDAKEGEAHNEARTGENTNAHAGNTGNHDRGDGKDGNGESDEAIDNYDI